jgi:hypothetical protein
MKWRLLLAVAAIIGLASPALAHRLDEYLQATVTTVDRHEINLRLSLTPGVAVAPEVLASIDADGNGGISADEERHYADLVDRAISLRIDGLNVPLKRTSLAFPSTEQLRSGVGDIVLTFTAPLPSGSRHSVELENTHQRAIAVYLVNHLDAERSRHRHSRTKPELRSVALSSRFQGRRALGQLIRASGG